LGTINSLVRYSTKISQVSTKIYHIEYKNILCYVRKYISDKVPKYIRLHSKIFLIVHQNISDCVLKYFRKTWRLRKHFVITYYARVRRTKQNEG
jgi:hypothetical protein